MAFSQADKGLTVRLRKLVLAWVGVIGLCRGHVGAFMEQARAAKCFGHHSPSSRYCIAPSSAQDS